MSEPSDRATFGERIGFAAQLIVLPAFSLYVVLCVRLHDGALMWPGLDFWSDLRGPTLATTVFYAAWIMLQLALAAWMPGPKVAGPPLREGGHHEYRRNGFAALLATYAVAALVVAFGLLPATFLYDELVPLAVTVNLGALALSVWIWLTGRKQANEAERARGFVEAFYLGATLNPRTGPIDWKYWMQGKPGLTLWGLLALSCAAASTSGMVS